MLQLRETIINVKSPDYFADCFLCGKLLKGVPKHYRPCIIVKRVSSASE